MTKIAVISNTFPPFSGGGVATAQYNLFLKLKEAGFEVKGFTFYDHGKIKLKEKDIIRCGAEKTIHRLINTFTKKYFAKKSKGKLCWQYNFVLNSAIGCWKLNSELKKFAPDIIIAPDLGSPTYYLKKPKNCKVIFISHHNPQRFVGNPLLGNYCPIDAELAAKVEQKALKIVDKVICPSEYMKDVFLKTHDFNGEVAVISNIINEESIKEYPEINIREELGLSSDAPLIYLPLGNAPVKGSKYMFEIIRRLTTSYKKPIGFYISAGTTEELSYELKYIPENAKIYAPGFLEYKKNIGIIKSCDFGITPTLLESFGMAILESLMCGVPFVSFNTGGNTDIINNGEDGFLVDYMDVESLIEKSILLLSDKNLLQNMQLKAKENAFLNYNSQKTLNNLVRIIKEN